MPQPLTEADMNLRPWRSIPKVLFSANGAIQFEPGATAPGTGYNIPTSAESAIQMAELFNPTRIVRRSRHHVSAGTHGILPERYAYGDVPPGSPRILLRR